MIALLLVICILLGVSMKTVSEAIKSDNNDIKNKISTMLGINLALMIFLGAIMYFYISSDAEFFKPYMMLMIHANLFLSITAVSICTIQKLN